MNTDFSGHLVSIVIPVYNEEENIIELYNKTIGVMSILNLPFEIIFVDDGSQDSTYLVLERLRNKDSHVKIVKVTKNSGQQYAFLAGFECARGEVIITMDGDLQNDPYDIPQFLAKIEEGFNLVNGWRYPRFDPLIRKFISYCANTLIGLRTGIMLHDYGCAFVAIKREITDKLKIYGSKSRFIKPLLVSLAGSVCEIKIRHYPRKKGTSTYNFYKILKSGLDFLLNFSVRTKGESGVARITKEVVVV